MLSGHRRTLLHLAVVFSEGFLVLLVGSSFGRGELGEEMTPIILFDLLHCQLTPGTGVCWLSASCRHRMVERDPCLTWPWVRAGQCGSRSKEVLRKKSPW